MVGTITVHGSDGMVMAPLSGGTFIQGKRFDIRIVKESDDEDLPLSVRHELVGLRVTTIFSSEQVGGAAPEGSRVAYASEVAEALIAAGKAAAAEELLASAKQKDSGSEYHFVVFKEGEYEFV